MSTGKLLTVKQAAEALNVCPHTIRAWLLRRRIGCTRLGRSVRGAEREVERLVTEGTIPARERNGRG